MGQEANQVLQHRLDQANYAKLSAIENPDLHRFVAEFLELCDPDTVFVATDQPEDIAYVRRRAIETGEERSLALRGHTVHFDGFDDQARDKENTKYLLSPGTDLGEQLNSVDREAGLGEVRSFLEGSMRGREVFVRLFCLGPQNSLFGILAAQLTDSSYVAHSEDMLYRPGYEEFRRAAANAEFFRFVHTEGELQNNVSANVGNRRVYIDLDQNTVYSTNTQYGGNTIGLKKLALRLAINKASSEGWLAEHMLVVGVHGPGERISYFVGAYPSACGKTSTAMLPGESILGDDIAYLRVIDGEARAVNVESGIFGIIRDVNPQDDPLIWKVLHQPNEAIFSNVLVTPDGLPYWLGMEVPTPPRGYNYSGEWWEGKTDQQHRAVTLAHRNARYTIRLEQLENCDAALHDPQGVKLSGVVYGGRDSDTCVPVEEAFDWVHGIITKGASLESETTAATLGKEGVRVFNPMSNIDFVSIPLGHYIQDNLDFGARLQEPPLVFGVNYFLKGDGGEYLNPMEDKQVWLKWMELRAHGEVKAVERPTGLIPTFEDLRALFREHLGRDYSRDDYQRQFAPRVEKNLEKLDRIEKLYRDTVSDAPDVLFEVLKDQRERLRAWQ